MVAPSTFAEGCITRCHIDGLPLATLCSLLQNPMCLLDTSLAVIAGISIGKPSGCAFTE